MFKRILIIVGVIVIFLAANWARQWWEKEQLIKTEQARELLRLQQTIKEDSVTFSTQSLIISDKKAFINGQGKIVRELEKKYDSTLDSYLKLQVQLDSLKQDSINTIPDTLDSNVVGFKGTVGNGMFDVWGNVKLRPTVYVYGVGLYQKFPILIDIALEKLPNEEYVAFTTLGTGGFTVKTNSIKVIENKRWIDNLYVQAHASLPVGIGVGLIYKNYGFSYLNQVNQSIYMFNYVKNIGEWF